MAYTTIDDPSAHFQVTSYTGNGSENLAITNGGNSDLQPDLVWIKNRTTGTTDSHCLFDSSRGATKLLSSDTSGNEATDADTLDSFASDGFQVDADVKVNTNTETYVAWQWKANGGTTTAGGGDDTVSTSTYQANTTAGFSVVTYTGTGSAATVAHGLGVAPQVVLVKSLDGTGKSWDMYHASVDETDAAQLDTNAAFYDSASYWNDTAPTSSVFTVGTSSETNGSGKLHVAYCWTPIQGYSKFGSYTGNGNADGTFVYTGFRPAFFMGKPAEKTGNWFILDSARPGYNTNKNILYPNLNAAEGTGDTPLDILSNGVKFYDGTNNWNDDGDKYIYMAFAENPFVTSGGVPCTAR